VVWGLCSQILIAVIAYQVKLNLPLKNPGYGPDSTGFNENTFNSFVDTYSPYITFGTESWLSPTIYPNEIFLHNYDIYRKDRDDGFGRDFWHV